MTHTPLPFDIIRRTVFLGDSITDGNTYPCFVRDALHDAGLPRMTAINAGIGGDTAGQMLARLERDVLPHQPTLVTLFAGANDAARKVTVEEYEANMRGIIVRLRTAQIPVLLLAPITLPRTGREGAGGMMEAYLQVVRQLAAEYDLRVAEVTACMLADQQAGHEQFAPDGHPGYQGQRMIARAVLDALGYPEAPLPARVHATVRPGVISPWHIRPVAENEPPLTEDTAACLAPGAEWATITLPEPQALTADEDLWLDDNRLLGFAVHTTTHAGGDSGKYLGIATLDAPAARAVHFHTGGQLMTIWLNGACLYRNDWQHGWHAGRESVPATLQPGQNTVVIETGSQFFLSVTEGSFWE